MFTTTAVILTIGIARWIEGRAQNVNLVVCSGAILIILGVIADRITWINCSVPHVARRCVRKLRLELRNFPHQVFQDSLA